MKNLPLVSRLTGALAITALAGAFAVSPPDEVVAIVNGREILAAEIEVSVRRIDEACRSQAEARKAECTEEDRARHERALVARDLGSRLQAMVEQATMLEFELSVSDEELRWFWIERMKEVDPAEVIEEHEATKALYAALEAVHERGEDPVSVYEQGLSQRISKEVWDIHVDSFRSPERRAVLRRLSERQFIELFEFPEGETDGIHAYLMKEKLEAAIDASIGRDDKQYSAHLKTTKARVTEVSHFEVANAYVQEVRRLWWVRQYESLSAEVLDEELRSALNWLAPAE